MAEGAGLAADLSVIERREIDQEIRRYERKEAACIDALTIVQKHRGWVSDDAVHAIATYLGMTADSVDGVATFYNLIYRRPVGRHVIHVCDSVSCWVLGYESLYDAIRKRLRIGFGETTQDGAFTLLPIPCLGHCEAAPAVMIDEVIYRNVDALIFDRILAEMRLADQMGGR